MIKAVKKHNYYLLVIICSLVIIITSYILKEVTPFGKNSLLTIDFFHQYGPMLGEFYRRIYNHDSLLYSFSMGLGLPFFRNYFNYLSSIFNMLLLLFRHRDLLTAYSIIIGLKAVASSITLAIFFKWKFGYKQPLIILCLLYAFSAYFVAYYWNIMWLDGMYMLPLIAMGIEKLIKDNKPLLYIISLSLMLFINYFIGYMLCIFSVLYFIMYLILMVPRFDFKYILKRFLNFFIASLVVGLLCGFFLIPLFFSLKSISATKGIWPTYNYYDFTGIQFFFSHFTGVNSTVLKADGICPPNISCGVISVALFLLFWVNNKISFKIKICYTLLLLVMAFSFIFAPLDYIWHGMHVPNDLPFRYSFIYSFIFTIISGYSLVDIKKIKPLYVLFVYFICMLFISLLKIFNYEGINNMMIILNGAIITIFYICYLCYIKHKKWGRWLFIIITIATMTERVMVINNNWSIDQNIADFYANDDVMNTVIHYLNHEEKDKFYRLEKASILTLNDSSWYGYYGATTFSSMEYANVAKLLFNLGEAGNEINSYLYKNNTPVYDMMFDIKYLINSIDDSLQYTFFSKIDDLSIYINKYNLGLMYGVNPEITNWEIVNDKPFVNQNNYIKYATGIDDVLKNVDNIDEELVYSYDDRYIVKYTVIDNYNNYYLYFPVRENCADFVVIDHKLYYFNDDYDYIDNYELPYYDIYDSIERSVIQDAHTNDEFVFYVGYTNYIDKNHDVYTLDMDKFLLAYNSLKKNKIEINEFKEDYIEGKIKAQDDYVIYTSIPYDDGWCVYVDNKQVDTFKLGDALLAFKVPKGEHAIKLKYRIHYIWFWLFVDVLIIASYIFAFKRVKRGDRYET